MDKKVKDNRGGSGRGQGRRLKYGEETVKVNYRVPISKKPELDNYVSKKLMKWAKESKNIQSPIGEGSAGKK